MQAVTATPNDAHVPHTQDFATLFEKDPATKKLSEKFYYTFSTKNKNSQQQTIALAAFNQVPTEKRIYYPPFHTACNSFLQSIDDAFMVQFRNDDVMYKSRLFLDLIRVQREPTIHPETKKNYLAILHKLSAAGLLHSLYLEHANLRMLTLDGLDLAKANLQFAKLELATMVGTGLNGADLSYSNQNYANRLGAHLDGAIQAEVTTLYENFYDPDPYF